MIFCRDSVPYLEKYYLWQIGKNYDKIYAKEQFCIILRSFISRCENLLGSVTVVLLTERSK